MRSPSNNVLTVSVFVGLAITMIAHAATHVPPDRTIVGIGAYTTGGYLWVTPASPGAEGCSYAPGDQVWIDWQSDPNGKSLYSTALAAYLAGNKVGYALSGCTSGGLPIVYRIDVRPN